MFGEKAEEKQAREIAAENLKAARFNGITDSTPLRGSYAGGAVSSADECTNQAPICYSDGPTRLTPGERIRRAADAAADRGNFNVVQSAELNELAYLMQQFPDVGRFFRLAFKYRGYFDE